ncbi:MAG: class I SAM-dependent methyltransferase [Acidimicrobiales bacterium]
MGLWSEHVVPRIVVVACNTKHERTVRARVCADLRGDLLEIGFGSGLNVPFYPPSVSSVWAVDPSAVSRRLASKRIARSSIPISYSTLDAQVLDVDTDRFDTVLSTYTLCTIPDPVAALRELHRVLKPGGRFCFLEHGRAPDTKVARHQDRMDPIEQRLLGGCHVTRDIPALVGEAGFAIGELDTYYAPGAPKFAGYMFEGWATPAPPG